MAAFTALVPEGWVAALPGGDPSDGWLEEWLTALSIDDAARASLRFWIDELSGDDGDAVTAFLVRDAETGVVDARFTARRWYGSEADSDRDAIEAIWPGAARLSDYSREAADPVLVAHTTTHLALGASRFAAYAEIAATIVRSDPDTAVYVELLTLGPSPFEELPLELASLAAAITSKQTADV